MTKRLNLIGYICSNCHGTIKPLRSHQSTSTEPVSQPRPNMRRLPLGIRYVHQFFKHSQSSSSILQQLGVFERVSGYINKQNPGDKKKLNNQQLNSVETNGAGMFADLSNHSNLVSALVAQLQSIIHIQ